MPRKAKEAIDPDREYGVKSAARAIGVDHRKLKRLLAAGEVRSLGRALKVPGLLPAERIPGAELLRWLASQVE
jgi:hypothetical protein